jgi:dihydroflavonol-4-reductase
MATTLVTGGTGAVGFNVIEALLADGQRVRALVRSAARARAILPAGCALCEGDVTDRASIARAMDEVSVVYHAAGLPEQWLRDPGTFTRVNVGGTENMIAVALARGVDRFVYTSTIDVFASEVDRPFDESVIATAPKLTHYERSKQEADRAVTRALDRGLPAVFIHPAALYGPAPAGSPGTNDFVRDLVKGKIPLLMPGGMPLVFSRDVGAGQLLAAKKAAIGSRYILADRYMELADLARAVLDQAGKKRIPPVVPVAMARVVSAVGEAISRLSGRPPLLPEGQLVFLLSRARPMSERARAELGWTPTPLSEGLRETLAFLSTSGR